MDVNPSRATIVGVKYASELRTIVLDNWQNVNTQILGGRDGSGYLRRQSSEPPYEG